MPRPPKKRRICREPGCSVFKPSGLPLKKSELIQLGLDEFEAMRLVDLEGLYQENAAEHMMTSRATLGRILEEARRKVALALVEGRPLEIAGGNVDICQESPDTCGCCGEEKADVHRQGCLATPHSREGRVAGQPTPGQGADAPRSDN